MKFTQKLNNFIFYKLKMKKLKKLVLAEGEHSGHKHVVTAFDAAQIIQKELGKFKIIDGKCVLSHEEHKEVLLLPDVEYSKTIQQEIDPLTNIFRSVID